MNTQRREEIREMMHKPAGNMHEMYHDIIDMQQALSDMLDHIDTLEQMAAERVIADGSRGPTPDYTGEGSAWVPPKIKPHIFAQMVNEVRDLARQYGQVEQFRCRVADLLGKYIHVEHNSKGVQEQTEAPVVVVPPLPKLTGSRADAAVWGIPQDIEDVCIQAGNPVLAAYQAGIRRGHAIAENGARAIPADRVLGEEMRQVDARRFARMQAEEAERPYLLELERYVRTMARLQNWSKDATDHGPLSSLDRLRANQ